MDIIAPAQKTFNFTIREDSSMDWLLGSKRNDPLNTRFAGLLCNKFRSDMLFYVEQDDVSIPAHRMIIGMASDVLDAMVYGDGLATQSCGADKVCKVSVPDCSADDFYQVNTHPSRCDVCMPASIHRKSHHTNGKHDGSISYIC